MPLTAQADGNDVVALLLSDEQWELLDGSTLRTRCCGRPAHRRTSKLGTRHFVHNRRGECVTAPESAEHLALKERIAFAVQAAGWDVLIEAQHGEFIADVEARRGDDVVAFEVQWSAQTEAEYQRRSALYAEAGIELVWLARPPGWNTAGVAPARVVWLERPSDGEPVPTRVRIAGRYPPVVQPLDALVADVLEGRASWREQVEMAEPMHALIVEIPEGCWKCSRPVTGHLVGGVAACCGGLWAYTSRTVWGCRRSRRRSCRRCGPRRSSRRRRCGAGRGTTPSVIPSSRRPWPAHDCARDDANRAKYGELRESAVAESIVGWTDLDGGPVRTGAPRVASRVWETAVRNLSSRLRHSGVRRSV
jgi:hypothetical protein